MVVAPPAADRAGGVASDAAAQAKEVAQDAAAQARQLVGRAREHLDTEAQQRSQQAAGAIRQVADQLDALRAGRAEQAGPLAGYVGQGQRSLTRLADRLDAGPTAVLDDIRRFARRQPVVFLAAAGGVGFVIGRLVRGARDAASDDTTSRTDFTGSGDGRQAELPPPAVVIPDTAATTAIPAVPPEGLP